MRCRRCNGFVASETIYAQGYWIQQNRCVNCGDVRFIHEPMGAPAPERRTGRGKDNHKRQRYGISETILKMDVEEWDLTSNNGLADRFGVSPTWISQLRRKVGRAKRYHNAHSGPTS
jgi:phage FluMu protein Com